MTASLSKGIVFDGHCDTAERVAADSRFELARRHRDGHIDIPRMEEGGLNAQIFAFCTDPGWPKEQWSRRTADSIEAFRRAVSGVSSKMALSPGSGTISEIVETGRIAAVLAVEGGHVISGLPFLKELYSKGIRVLSLTWKNTNEIADSSEDAAKWGGLSGFGAEVVAAMNSMGMLIDCSHASRKTFFDVVEASARPVILSHSCVSAICDIPRNADDEQLAALRENGGVICVNFFPAFLNSESNRDIMGIWGEYRRRKNALAETCGGDPERASRELLPVYLPRLRRLKMPGVEAVADHIDHAVEAAGVDHVGIGSDFDGIPVTPAGLEDVSRLPLLREELLRRGYSGDDTGKIMGGNLQRLASSVCGCL